MYEKIEPQNRLPFYFQYRVNDELLYNTQKFFMPVNCWLMLHSGGYVA